MTCEVACTDHRAIDNRLVETQVRVHLRAGDEGLGDVIHGVHRDHAADAHQTAREIDGGQRVAVALGLGCSTELAKTSTSPLAAPTVESST